MIQFPMAEDVRRGDVAYQPARPASWLGSRLGAVVLVSTGVILHSAAFWLKRVHPVDVYRLEPLPTR